MKQIRDITYDIEDCIDDSAHRLHGLRNDMCCYFLVNSVHEVLTWWPRRDLAMKISILKTRAQQISERRHRYGVDNPRGSGLEGYGSAAPITAGFDAADNQGASLQLVAVKDPVGVEEDMEELEKWVTDIEHKDSVLYIVGFGGVGKTTIATALYSKLGDQFDHRAMVTVSQSSDLEAILTSIKSQVMPQFTSSHRQQPVKASNPIISALDCLRRATLSTVMAANCCSAGTVEKTQPGDNDEQQGSLPVKHPGIVDRVRRGMSPVIAKCCGSSATQETQWERFDHPAALTVPRSNLEPRGSSLEGCTPTSTAKGIQDLISRGTSAVMSVFHRASTSKETRDDTRLYQLKRDLTEHLEEKRYEHVQSLLFCYKTHLKFDQCY
jgi:hypothetical protein